MSDLYHDRRFLLLQGPHGPFFHQLGRMLRAAGCEAWRVGFNRGDAAFWPDKASYIPYTGTVADWPGVCAELIDDRGITDIVLYGDTRPVHAEAIAVARKAGLTVHVFEEGYLRPYWVTYERGGSNGHSRLMQFTVDQMCRAVDAGEAGQPDAPDHWGDMRQHIFYGALYHYFMLFRKRPYRSFEPHREISLAREFQLHLRRLLLMPMLAAGRLVATRRIKRGGFPYHLVLLQLAHDASFRAHGPFTSMSEFIELTLDGFARGAPAHHHLVFKAHPLEDGREPLRSRIAAAARRRGLSGRVHFVHGGKLAGLLDHARSAVTVNSTAAQQALWRGLPLKVFGDAVYAKPEFVSAQPLHDFFAKPDRPDARAYLGYRRFLLETSQLAGGFYSARGRRQLLRRVVDTMLADLDPYDAIAPGNAAPGQQLRLVR